ncbi:MAG: TIM barrel protein [Planctomycetota bacterium]|nr:TIM barrel protein [Planctomycetota bacterium]MDA1214273.1 TIM barrel protein [Planctomycetota bacterium]
MIDNISRRTFVASAFAGGAIASMNRPVLADEKSDEDISKIGKTPHTRFAVNCEMWWNKLPFIERIRKTAELGFPAFEFWPWAGKDLDAIAGLSKDLGLTVAQFTAWGFRPGLNDPTNHADFVKAIKEGCQVAHQLECKMMTVVGGDDIEGVSQKEMHAQIIKGLKLAAPIAEDNDVTLILEPMNIRVDHKGHCLYGSAPAIRICDEVDSSHVKINWDLYHMHITEGDLCGHLREGFAAGRIGYLQLADHPGRNEPGTGEIHYNRVLKEAHDLGYDYFVGLECRQLEDELTAARRVAAADVW